MDLLGWVGVHGHDKDEKEAKYPHAVTRGRDSSPPASGSSFLAPEPSRRRSISPGRRSTGLNDAAGCVGLEEKLEKLQRAYEYCASNLKERDRDCNELRTALQSVTTEKNKFMRKYSKSNNKRKELESELQDRDNEIDAIKLEHLRQVSTLREDRTALGKEVMQLRSELVQMHDQLEELKLKLEESKEVNEKLSLLVEEHDKSMYDARTFAAESRATWDRTADDNFRKRFSLPSTEFEVASFYCSKGWMSGWFYVSPSFLCFEPVVWAETGRVVIPIESVTNIEKMRSFYYIPGTSSGLRFVLKSRKVEEFTGFSNRDEVITNVVTQALKFNHRIDVTAPIHAAEARIDAAGEGTLSSSNGSRETHEDISTTMLSASRDAESLLTREISTPKSHRRNYSHG